MNENASVIRIKYRGGLRVITKVGEMELNGDEIILQAKDSKLAQGAYKLENRSHIGYWTNPKDVAEWDINVPAPGKYDVKLFYACDSEHSGSDVVFTIDGQRVKQTVKPTGSWSKYSVMELGLVELNKVGNTTCTVGFGEKKGRALMNLKAIVLDPTE